MPNRTSKQIAALLVLVVPLVATLLTIPMPVSAQAGLDRPAGPFLSIARYSCPDDIASGDDLLQRCHESLSETVTIDGPVRDELEFDTSLPSQTFDDLPTGTYSVASSGIGDRRSSLVVCSGYRGPSGLPPVPFSYGETAATFAVDVALDDAGSATVYCSWFDLPSASVEQPGGIIVYSRATSSGGASSGERDLTLTGAALDDPIAIDTSEGTGALVGPAINGPILLPAGDYTLENANPDNRVDVTIASGEILTPDVTQNLGPDTDVTPTPAPDGATFSLPGTSLDGAYTDLDSDLYGDEAGALYGADSGYATGTLIFDAPDPDATTGATLTLLGLDDELDASTEISVSVNGTEIYRGDSTFPAWTPSAPGNQWGEFALDIDPELLLDTDNELVLTNLSAGDEAGTPPWVMITRVTFSS